MGGPAPSEVVVTSTGLAGWLNISSRGKGRWLCRRYYIWTGYFD